MQIPWSRALDARYRGRSELTLLRARAMLVTYSVGALGAIVMIGHDFAFDIPRWELHLLNSCAIFLTCIGGIALLLRGHMALASQGAIVATVIFSVMAMLDQGGGVPDEYYDTFARWYPVFIVATTLFARPVTAIFVTAISIIIHFGYYIWLCRDLPPPRDVAALADAVEMSAVNLIVGAMAFASMRLVAGAMRAAQREIQHRRELADDLELRVDARTQELSTALVERQAILDNLLDGLATVDAAGERIDLANRAFTDLYALDETIAGDATDDVFPDDLLELLAQAEEDVVVGEVALPDERIGRATLRPFSDAAGARRGVIIVVRDVTLETEVDRMKTDFISTVSHELRTPLTSVLGFAQIIKSRLERRVFGHVPADDPKAQKAVEQVRTNVGIIVTEGTRLTALINDLLDISKMEAGKMEYRREPVAVAALVEQAAASVASLFDEDAEPRLELDLAEDLPEVIGDEARLVQVLVNLLSNARKFTDEGAITVSAQPVEGGVELAVADTGDGIDPAQHEMIFQKFRQVGDTLTNRPAGTGLGLPICLQIVRAHGGEITLESALGEGSRFAFVLPLGSPS